MLCVAAIVLTLAGSGRFDSTLVRRQLQEKYDERAVVVRAGKSPYSIGYSTRFRFVDFAKRQILLPSLQHTWESQSVGRKLFSQVVSVESADTLQDRAKAAVHIQEHEVRTTNGGSVLYDRDISAEDTWIRAGADWILLQTRLTRQVVRRNGKVISSQSEKVRTDFDRQYGRRSG